MGGGRRSLMSRVDEYEFKGVSIEADVTLHFGEIVDALENVPSNVLLDAFFEDRDDLDEVIKYVGQRADATQTTKVLESVGINQILAYVKATGNQVQYEELLDELAEALEDRLLYRLKTKYNPVDLCQKIGLSLKAAYVP